MLDDPFRLGVAICARPATDISLPIAAIRRYKNLDFKLNLRQMSKCTVLSRSVVRIRDAEWLY